MSRQIATGVTIAVMQGYITMPFRGQLDLRYPPLVRGKRGATRSVWGHSTIGTRHVKTVMGLLDAIIGYGMIGGPKPHCMRPGGPSWPVQCILCRRRIHPWCAPSPYEDAHPILCRFCVQTSHGSGVPFRLHNVLTRPGFVISGCAEPALVDSADDEPVISVPSSPRR